MKDYVKEATDKVYLVLVLLILAAVVLAFLGGSQYVNLLSSWAATIVAGIITTAVVQVIIQTVSGDFFEKIPLTFKIRGYEFSFSLFFVITIILRFLIFH